jgi:hypothetical protein
MMDDIPLDDMPGYSDLSEAEKWIVLLYRRLKSDYSMIQYQAEEGMLDQRGAMTMGIMASTSFHTNVQKHLVSEIKKE